MESHELQSAMNGGTLSLHTSPRLYSCAPPGAKPVTRRRPTKKGGTRPLIVDIQCHIATPECHLLVRDLILSLSRPGSGKRSERGDNVQMSHRYIENSDTASDRSASAQ